jgi:arylsulfatase A-like enzyme
MVAVRHLRTRAALICALLWPSFLACDEAPSAPVHPTAESIVWIIVDAARARSFGIYGNPIEATPQIDEFAAEATVFERAYCQVPWTLGSASSYLTGKYPLKQVASVVPGQTLAHHLSAAGFRTAAFSENPYVTPEFGFADGFETFRDVFPNRVLTKTGNAYPRPDSAATVEEAIAWLDDIGDERFFLYVHLLPPHAPYDPPAPFAGRLDPDYHGSLSGLVPTLVDLNKMNRAVAPRDLEHLRLQYLENLAYADTQVGHLLAAVRARAQADTTLIVVASDHGEGFREHGFLQHNFTLYEEVLHVPLIVRFPPALGAVPPSWPAPVELRRTFDTVCDALGVASCGSPDASLLAEVQGRVPTGRAVFSISALPGGGAKLSGIIQGHYKLIARGPERRATELYDLAADPAERNNLRDTHPSVARHLEKTLQEAALERVAVESRGSVRKRRKEQLGALGYLE